MATCESPSPRGRLLLAAGATASTGVLTICVGNAALFGLLANRPAKLAAIIARAGIVFDTGVIAVCALAMVAFLIRHRLRPAALTLVDSARILGRDLFAFIAAHLSQPRTVVVLLLLVLTGLGLRIYYLQLPMASDEAETFCDYIAGNLAQALNYSAPNNHVLNTLFAKTTTALLGDATWAIRLPAFLSGVLLIPLVFLVTRTLFPVAPGTWAAALVAGAPGLIDFSTQARGYSIACIFLLAMLTLGLYTIRRTSPVGAVVTGWLGAMSLLAVPTSLLAVAPIMLWLTFKVWTDRRSMPQAIRPGPVLWLSWAALGVFCLLAYLPVVVVSGVDALVANRFIIPLSYSVFCADFVSFPTQLSQALFPDWHPAVLLSLAVCACLALSCHGRAGRDLFALTICSVGFVLVFMVCRRVVPPPRTLLFLVPAVFGLFDMGSGLLRRRLGGALRSGILLDAAALGIAIALAGRLLQSRSTFDRKHVDVVQIAASLADLRPGDNVLAPYPICPPLRYYLRQAGLPDDTVNGTGPGRTLAVLPRTPFAVGGEQERRLQQAINEYHLELLREFGTASVYEVHVNSPRRGDRVGPTHAE